MIAEIIYSIKSVPDVIWSGVIAALIALSGVWLSNKSNDFRLGSQLKHDADEKSKERIHKLRSEVYLGVVSSIETTNIHLSTLSSRDFTKSDMSLELQAIAAVMAKLKLVAESETSKLATELGIAFGSVFLKLLSHIMPLQKEKAEIEINHELSVGYDKDSKRIQLEINQLVESGAINYLRFQALQSALEFSLGQSKYYAAARSEAYKRQQEKLQEFNSILLQEMKGLTEVQLRVMISARRDLGLDSDEQELRRQLELQWAVMGAAYGDTIASLNS